MHRGRLARRRGLVTFFGKFADPLADKIMVMALLVYLTAEGRMFRPLPAPPSTTQES